MLGVLRFLVWGSEDDPALGAAPFEEDSTKTCVRFTGWGVPEPRSMNKMAQNHQKEPLKQVLYILSGSGYVSAEENIPNFSRRQEHIDICPSCS